MSEHKLRLGYERKRDLGHEQSLFHPLYLHFSSMIDEIKNFFDELPSQGLVIYDFGCGSKPYKSFAKKNTYMGIDIDSKNVLADVHSDIHNVPVGDETADVVVSFCTLEHVEEPIKVMIEMHRILRKHGRLFVVVPLYWEEHEQPYDFYRFTRYGLEYLAKQSGFKEIDIREVNGGHALVGMNLARLATCWKVFYFMVPLINYVFRKLENRSFKKSKKDNIKLSNVMTFSMRAIKK